VAKHDINGAVCGSALGIRYFAQFRFRQGPKYSPFEAMLLILVGLKEGASEYLQDISEKRDNVTRR
jgi:hypothetical protein